MSRDRTLETFVQGIVPKAVLKNALPAMAAMLEYNNSNYQTCRFLPALFLQKRTQLF